MKCIRKLLTQMVLLSNLVFVGGRTWLYLSRFVECTKPYNYFRKIVGFDTFEGFPSVDKKDGADIASIGTYSVTNKYEKYLAKVLDYHESESPISHIKKYELIKGDATKTIHQYLKANPETIIALAYFDLTFINRSKCVLNRLKVISQKEA